MSDTPKFSFRSWLVPPVLLPILTALLVATSVILHREAVFMHRVAIFN